MKIIAPCAMLLIHDVPCERLNTIYYNYMYVRNICNVKINIGTIAYPLC